MREIPGVQVAAAVNIPPAVGSNSSRQIEIDGRPNPDPADPPSVDYRAATPGYLRDAGHPNPNGPQLHRCRSRGHAAGRRRLGVAGETLLAQRGPDRPPDQGRHRANDLTVVGVCGDIIHDWFITPERPDALPPVRAGTGRVHGVRWPEHPAIPRRSPPDARAQSAPSIRRSRSSM